MSTNKKHYEQKTLPITSQRRITIPQSFYSELGFKKEAICIKEDGMLIVCPIESDSGNGFSEQIISDLIAEGYSGQELLKEFKNRRSRVRPVIEKMIEAAHAAVQGIGEFSTYDEVFGEDG